MYYILYFRRGNASEQCWNINRRTLLSIKKILLVYDVIIERSVGLNKHLERSTGFSSLGGSTRISFHQLL